MVKDLLTLALPSALDSSFVTVLSHFQGYSHCSLKLSLVASSSLQVQHPLALPVLWHRLLPLLFSTTAIVLESNYRRRIAEKVSAAQLKQTFLCTTTMTAIQRSLVRGSLQASVPASTGPAFMKQ